jgi:ATPase family associated with various cellular activities (AAA)
MTIEPVWEGGAPLTALGLRARIVAGMSAWLKAQRPPPAVSAAVALASDRLQIAATDELIARAQRCFKLDDTELAVLFALHGAAHDPACRLACGLGVAIGAPNVASVSALLAITPTWQLSDRALQRFGLVTVEPTGGLHAGVQISSDFLMLHDGSTTPPGLVRARFEPSDSLAPAIAAAAHWLTMPGPRVVVVVGAAGTGRDTAADALVAAAWRPAMTIASADLAQPSVLARLRWYDAIARLTDEPTPSQLEGLAGAAVMIARTPSIAAIVGAIDVLVLDVPSPAPTDRTAWWHHHAGAVPPLGLGRRFGPGRVAAAARLARNRAMADARALTADDLAWACRTVASGDLGRLAHHLPGVEGVDGLILAPATARDFQRAIDAAQAASVVADRWNRDGRGGAVGLAVLFAGPPGTGKTFAARIFAKALARDVYRVDLSQIVDKYVGETEKHLDRLFAAAADTEVIVFFDEADALFGSRTTGDDSHGHYHNQTVGFLLQRIEDHPGITLLATNLRAQLDPAFARRMHAVIEFRAPDAPERNALWRRYLPPEVSRDDLAWLAARWPLTGADIRAAALGAELAATAAARSVITADVAIAVWTVLNTAGRLTTLDEFGPWRSEVEAFTRRGQP